MSRASLPSLLHQRYAHDTCGIALGSLKFRSGEDDTVKAGALRQPECPGGSALNPHAPPRLRQMLRITST